MLSQFSSCGIPLIIALCWLSVNDAIPFGPYPAGEVRPTASLQSKSWNSTIKRTPITEQPPSVTGTPKSATDSFLKSTNTKRRNVNFNFNSNINVNDIHDGFLKPAGSSLKSHNNQPTKNNSDDDSEIDSSEESNSSNNRPSDDSVPELETKKVSDKKEESPEKCMNEARRQNQTYTRSFPLNISSIDLAEEFKIAGEAEAKKTSSVHIGEDIALCWIETTTIKEDSAFDPPKRLVIREFTISFENSATIPDNYLECDKLEGEIATGDEETVGKTSFKEVIDENTKRSRVVNFTSISHVGPIIVRQRKKVRCGVGAVVSKDIYEWPDGTENPKKRVEIKVGPSIRDLGIGSHAQTGECATESVPKSPKADESSSSSSDCSSSESCEISSVCEEGEDCNRSSTIPTCEEDDCSTRGLPEETVPSTYPPDSNDLLSTGVTRRTATKEPEEVSTLLTPLYRPEGITTDSSDEEGLSGAPGLKELTTPLPHKSDRVNGDPCQEDDADCVSGKSTFEPETFTERPAKSGYNPEDLTTESSGKSCPEGSEDCSCSGSSCLIHSSEEPNSLETENKRTDTTTILSGNAPNGKSTEFTIKSSNGTTTPRNDSECDSESGECLSSSQTEEVVSTKPGTVPGRNVSEIGEPTGNNEESITMKHRDGEATTQQPGEMERPDTIKATEEPGLSKDSSNTESIPELAPCNSSGTEDCATARPGNKHFSDEKPIKKDDDDSTKESTETPVTTKGDSQPSRPKFDENERTLSCDQSSDDENCKTTDSSGHSDAASESDSSVTVPITKELEEGLNSTTPEGPQGVTNSINDAITTIPTTRTDEGTSNVETTTGLPESIRKSSLPKEESTECSPGSENGDCGRITTSSSLTEIKTNLTPDQGETTLSPDSCESSDSCGSTEDIAGLTETILIASINTTATATKLDESTCDESSESCESPSSGSGSETCEDGSSSGDCTSKSGSLTSESCDSSSGSCSSESSNPTTVISGTITTTTEPTSKELEYSSTTIDNVSTTAETRRSTVPTLSLIPPPSKGRHRFALRIKVLLEHIKENKEKEKLVQVEKNLLLNENPNEHGNHSLLWQIKSLNNTMNIETLKEIFNCSAFAKLSKDASNPKEFGQDREESVSLHNNAEDSSLEESMDEAAEENSDNSTDGSNESSTRKKREVTIPEIDVVKRKNITEAKATAIRESLPGVEEDFKKGLDHVLSRISKELAAPTSGGVGKAADSSSSSILKLLASPSDGRVHSRRRRRAEKVGGVMFVEQLKNPVKGEEIDRWSNERLVSAADGGKVRSVTEFKILRDAVEDSRKVPSES